MVRSKLRRVQAVQEQENDSAQMDATRGSGEGGQTSHAGERHQNCLHFPLALRLIFPHHGYEERLAELEEEDRLSDRCPTKGTFSCASSLEL